MARTAAMRLVELMVLKQDIHEVLKYLGKLGEFQFQDDVYNSDSSSESAGLNPDGEIFASLERARGNLGLPELNGYKGELDVPSEEDSELAGKLIANVEKLHKEFVDATAEHKKVCAAYDEALAFSNLKVAYSELESLSFLTIRIGKIDDNMFDVLSDAVSSRATVVHLGQGDSRVLVACAKKARFFVDGELKKVGFVELEVPRDFKGMPDDVLETLHSRVEQTASALEEVKLEIKNYAETHKEMLYKLLQVYSVGSQIYEVENKLESTEMVYRLTGWIPEYESRTVMKDLDELTKGRTAIRIFLPSEVASVVNGIEKVPVKLKHGKLVSNFERMIFSYGSPLYGTVDPTPFVAVFFTVLFGIMFGDAGQGLVFLILGILMQLKLIKIGGWEKFGLVFISIGVSSTVMGLLTGEFFANEEILVPFGRFVTGLFGEPRDQILHMMPSSDAESIKHMFMFFGFTVAVGFIINSCGLILNIINQFSMKKVGKALFSKTGISGAVFFWYVIAFALRIAFFGHKPALYDWIILGTTLFLTIFSEPLERLFEGEKPIFENGVFTGIISAVVELIEVISSYLSNTVSFLRVGAFALAHAVLGYIISMMSSLAGPVGGVAVSLIGNAIVVVLEGMIVAIQVVRLQYYEFFSKFFTETGREFKPFHFEYSAIKSA